MPVIAPEKERTVRTELDLFEGDRLVSPPCRVEVLTIDGTTAWARCHSPECRGQQHAIDVPLYEAGGGPWRRPPGDPWIDADRA